MAYKNAKAIQSDKGYLALRNAVGVIARSGLGMQYAAQAIRVKPRTFRSWTSNLCADEAACRRECAQHVGHMLAAHYIDQFILGKVERRAVMSPEAVERASASASRAVEEAADDSAAAVISVSVDPQRAIPPAHTPALPDGGGAGLQAVAQTDGAITLDASEKPLALLDLPYARKAALRQMVEGATDARENAEIADAKRQFNRANPEVGVQLAQEQRIRTLKERSEYMRADTKAMEAKRLAEKQKIEALSATAHEAGLGAEFDAITGGGGAASRRKRSPAQALSMAEAAKRGRGKAGLTDLYAKLGAMTDEEFEAMLASE